MKQKNKFDRNAKRKFTLFHNGYLLTAILIFSFSFFLSPFSSFSQKSTATIDLEYVKKADNTKTAVAVIKAKNKEGKFAPAQNVRVNFYAVNGGNQQLIKSVNTDDDGKAAVELQKNLPFDESRYFTIVAKIENDSLFENIEEKAHYKEANIILSLNPHDTSRTVTAHVAEIGTDGKEIPVKDAEVKFYVKRLFGNMPAAQDNAVTTNDKGEATFVYPKNIPGGETGELILVARMDDNDTFGTIESNAKAPWGTIVPVDPNPFPRAMWMPDAPIPLLLFFCIVFGGIWSIYFFIVFQVTRINNEKNENKM